MDFRSQLSAFQSGSNRGRGQSPQRNSRGYNSNNTPYGRGGGGGSGDRRRPRDWSPHHYQQGRGSGGPPPHARRRFQSPEDRDGLGDLRRHGYKIPRGLPSPPTAKDQAKKPKHLALLVICIEDLPYEHIWREWLDTFHSEQDDHYVSILCHAKFPQQVKSEWLKQRLLVFPPKSGRGNSYLDPEYLTRTPSWGSVEITRAMLDLLHTGLRIGNDSEKDPRFSSNRFLSRRPRGTAEDGDTSPVPEVDQFLYISETCLPVATAQEFMDTMENTVSWVNARHRKDPDTPSNAYENDQFGLINRRIPGQYRWKADQWVMLCRKHASQIIGLDRPHIPHKFHLWHSYREINASDEMYIPTSLALLGYLRFTSQGEDTQRLRIFNHNTEDGSKSADKPSTTGSAPPTPVDPSTCYEFVKKRPVTYTDWSEGMRNPAMFTKGLSDFQKVARLARAKGCLVARKFALYVALPDKLKKDHEVTGQLSAEEWRNEMETLVIEQPQTKDVKAETTWASSSNQGEDKETNTDDRANEDKKGDDNEEGEEESLLVTEDKPATTTEEKEAQDREDDEEEEENQL